MMGAYLLVPYALIYALWVFVTVGIFQAKKLAIIIVVISSALGLSSSLSAMETILMPLNGFSLYAGIICVHGFSLYAGIICVQHPYYNKNNTAGQ